MDQGNAPRSPPCPSRFCTWVGSRRTPGWPSCSKRLLQGWMSTPESQQCPGGGCGTTLPPSPPCPSVSVQHLVWNTGSTASTDIVPPKVPLTRPTTSPYSSTNEPRLKPITSIGSRAWWWSGSKRRRALFHEGVRGRRSARGRRAWSVVSGKKHAKENAATESAKHPNGSKPLGARRDRRGAPSAETVVRRLPSRHRRGASDGGGRRRRDPRWSRARGRRYRATYRA